MAVLHPGMSTLTDDALAGDLRVFQRRGGHRFSLDDVVTAWEAASERPDARRCLDLGCGIGSVLLMLAYKLGSAELVGVEAQDESFALGRRNVDRNGLTDRVALVHADIRDEGLALAAAPFDLVTGTPPYTKPTDGTLSPDAQRAHARFELRGGVEDYLRAASRFLAPDGRVVICAAARADGRVRAGAAAARLAPIRRRVVIPRDVLKDPLFTVWTLAHEHEAGAEEDEPAPFVVRDASGRRTPQAIALRAFFGLPVEPDGRERRSREAP